MAKKFSDLTIALGDLVIDHFPGADPLLENVSSIEQATPQTISYIEGGKFADFLQTTQAGALILPHQPSLLTLATDRGIPWLSCQDARLGFAKIIGLFYQPIRPTPGIHPTAVIGENVTIGKDVYIGPYVVIEAGSEIGDRCCLYPHVVIYPQVKIGENTIIHAHATIEERVILGKNCVIHSGAVIGGEGFGFVPTAQGWYKMEQSGQVIIHDGVEIGCNSTVDRPAVGYTRINSDTKLDNLVHIGHNSTLGSNCALAAQVGLAGGVTIHNGVLMGGQSGAINNVSIGSGAIVTAQTGVTSDVPPQEMVSGMPSVPHRLYLRMAAISKKMPAIYKLLKAQLDGMADI
ncbi:MAG: UDP-3-O-(3-hydroxymyristoyl)glucosamine N-acyltransferase [Synechococcaceae cyanobacterium RL_1_2]|nr:UDP-3-O-(3-hydroxymyristoyl)glucosamine N-acyltransferase [Synechococcaceae cyanobacterium RL_1_2]